MQNEDSEDMLNGWDEIRNEQCAANRMIEQLRFLCVLHSCL